MSPGWEKVDALLFWPLLPLFGRPLTEHAPHHTCTPAPTQTDWTVVQKGQIARILGLVKPTHWLWRRQSPNSLYHSQQLDFQEHYFILRTLPQCPAVASTAWLCLSCSHKVAFFWQSSNILLPPGDVCVPPAQSAVLEQFEEILYSSLFDRGRA